MKRYSYSDKAIDQAVGTLRDGGLVCFPTETVYGLGADATNDEACKNIYRVKGRPSVNPLIVHCDSLTQAESIGFFSPMAKMLATLFWPGPLTLILPLKKPLACASVVVAGLETVGIRLPAHPVARRLLEAYGKPIAAPSANLSGYLSPTAADHVEKYFKDTPGILIEGGHSSVGLESTIVDVTQDPPHILRYGGLDVDRLLMVYPFMEFQGTKEGGSITSPGQLLAHYAPRVPLRLNATSVTNQEALLAFGKPLKGAKVTFNLSLEQSLLEASHCLFQGLHWLEEQPGIQGIAVQSIPEIGLGVAINDRLRRGAQGPKIKNGDLPTAAKICEI